MKRTWRLSPAQKWQIKMRYCRRERVKTIAADFRICTKQVSRIAWSRGAERRDRVHVRES